MNNEFSEQLNGLRDAITEALWNSESVQKAIHALSHRPGSDVQLEISLVLLNVEPDAEVGSAACEYDPSAKLILSPTDSLFLRTLNISDL
jgi:hypothetical protein